MSVPWVLLCASTTCIFATPGLAAADLDRTVDFHIPAQPLDGALLEFSRQAHIQLAINAGSLRTVEAPSVNGTLPASTALAELLVHSGLEYDTVGSTVTIAPIVHAAAAPAATVDQGSTATSSQPRAPSSSGTVGDAQTAWPLLVEEIIVSAQKRDERLQDVPVPVTAISAVSLIENNQLRLQDYFSSVPGLSVVTNDNGAPQLAIRGLTTGGYTNPTVGVVIDDVPYGSSSALVLGEAVPDIDPSDLTRVEVLRGPQGTLYGASSLGGLVKYVTIDPSTEGITGRAQLGTNSVHNGDELGYSARGSVNVPLSETLAVRASGFTRQDPGYIDDPAIHQNGVNEARDSGGRLSGLWRPSQDASLKISALFQNARGDGSSQVDLQPGLGDLQQNDARGSGRYNNSIQAYSATAKAKLADINLTSLTGYSINRISESYDYTFALGQFLALPTFGVTGSPFVTNSQTRKFTEEFRLSGSVWQRFDWLAGVFYNHEQSAYAIDYLATDFNTGALAGNGLHFSTPFTFTDRAVFADLTFHFTEQFDLQVGGRESENRQVYSESFVGDYTEAFLLLPSPVNYPRFDTKDHSFTYLVTPRLKIGLDFMVYARLASGFRPGGPNASLSVGLVPPAFGPDKTENYELGVKGDVLEHVLSVDASVYYINWKDIQLQSRDPVSGGVFFANGGKAKSEGVELSLEARPVSGMKVGAWVNWNEAVLTQTLPVTATVVGGSGDRLPGGSRYSGNVSMDQEIPLTDSLSAFVGASASYVGSRYGVFLAVPQRQYFPSYMKTDLRAGARFDSWTANLFVNNLADKRGVLAGGAGTLNPTAFNYIQPRTVGLSVAKTF